MNIQQLWKATLGNLEVSLSKAHFHTWFKQTKIVERNENGVVIGVPNGFTKEWLQNKYHKVISQSLRKIDPTIRDVHYRIDTRIQTSDVTPIDTRVVHITPEVRPAEKLESTLNDTYDFDTFVVGDNNQLAQAASVAVTKNPGTVYNPLFIYGGVGLGKTHLLQAIGNEIKKHHPEKRVMYVSSERFTNEFIQSISQGKGEQFKNRYRSIDCLLIDDIQFLAGKESTQEEFFHTFNALHQNNKQVVMTSDRLPKAIPALEDRLVSRFEWGMIADVQAPTFETRLAILKTKTRVKGYNIPDDVLSEIANRVQRNIRELEGALNRLMAYCSINNCEPSLERVASVLQNLSSVSKKKHLSANEIIQTVAHFYNLTNDDLRGPSRKKEFVKPRQIAMYLIRKEIDGSFPSIGTAFGNRDHTTVMYACDKVSNDLQEQESLKQEVNMIVEKLYVNAV